MSSNDVPDARSARRAQREAERAARAQRKADAARERALAAARAGGLFEGMEAMPRTAAADTTTGGEAEPADSGEAEPAGTERARATPGPTREPLDSSRRRRLTVVLAAASAVLVVVTGLTSWQYVEARGDAATEQRVADAPASATDAAREIVTQMFTYDHRTVDSELAAVRDRLADPALSEFVEQSMPTVASAAKQQEASVYATVAAAAPQEVVDADNVTVLLMLNRMVSTKDAPEAASSASRLTVSMVRVDDTWRLGELEAL
ncbi:MULTISPECIES: hypothetical protein [Dietzia]|uniref:Mce-associated membrane protein n=3 Tax=Dietzia TaxID=37914 RepID=A0AAD0JPL0_9ACTN|nr:MULTISPECIES: hypothetical protein [Dietzia]AWH94719.1 hypothetical protein A6048_03480 [Dietzia psychralcaliphila]MCT1513761.1 hypothetical protein [Dietzia cercidiphylli]PTM86408.1 hypothetical protein C8N39_10774 [Dietzia psychralcaliphila]